MQSELVYRPVYLAIVLFLLCARVSGQDISGPPETGIDQQGNVWVAAEDGHHLTMATRDHCLEVRGAESNDSIGCLVLRGVGDQGFIPQLQVEIYLVGGRRLVLEPGGAIQEWRYLNKGEQVAISFKAPSG